MSHKTDFISTLFYETIRFTVKWYLRVVHRFKITGLDKVPRSFDKLIIISNHASLLDGLILWAWIDLPMKIIVNRGRAQEWLLRPFMQNRFTVPTDTMNPYALKEVIEEVNEGIVLLIFPEGRITRTGNLMKIYEGAGFVAYKTGARILPVYLDGSFNTVFSRKQGGGRFFTPIRMTIGDLHEPITVDHLPPRERKKLAAETIYEILCSLRYTVHDQPSTLGREFILGCRRNGKRPVYKDALGTAVTYKKALRGAFALGSHLSRLPEKNVGILLPNLTITALLFWALQIFRRTAVFLNYSVGPGALTHAMDLAELDLVITSRQLLERMKLDVGLFDGRRVIFVDELKDAVSLKDKLTGLFLARFPHTFLRTAPTEPKETAVILFTSGSEGTPKGVCLSHENILSNIHQMSSRIDIQQDDYFFSALPIFHSFGLTIGAILPVFSDTRAFLYANPLHYRIIPEIIYDEACTIVMGTNTFLNGYARKAHPYDFHTMRYIYCGAEGLTDTVFNTYAKKYGVRVMSGYGATECSPVVTMNSALQHEYGTVGKVLSGIQYKLVPVTGIDSGNDSVGRLFVKGKNVMKGYLKNDKANHKYLVEDQGWYDTGDIVEITPTGYLRIVGRLKRFSKISGEMVSLTAVEDALTGMFGERKDIAVVAVPDEKKGEQLVLITTYKDAHLKEVREKIRGKGLSDLACPREIIYMREIPKLGTGKVDYVKLNALLLQHEVPQTVLETSEATSVTGSSS